MFYDLTWEGLTESRLSNNHPLPCRRRGRVVEGIGFENRRLERVRGFESLRLRIPCSLNIVMGDVTEWPKVLDC